jgi:tetratricopeptide (TPR) repeat protein
LGRFSLIVNCDEHASGLPRRARPPRTRAAFPRELTASDPKLKGEKHAMSTDPISDYNQAIALDPNNASAYVSRAKVFLRKGAVNQAISDYTQAIVLDPKNATAYVNRGVAYAKKGGLDQAISDFSQAIAFDPNNANVYVNRGLAYKSKKMKREAIADFKTYLQLVPNASNRAAIEKTIRELGGRVG